MAYAAALAHEEVVPLAAWNSRSTRICPADLLTAAGHDAMTVYQQSLDGAPDQGIVDVCNEEGRILVTADLDLSDIRL